MASAMALASIPHQAPPFSLPHLPRVRPPRLLKGTPNANTNPQPPGEVPKKKVWVQGKWREPGSNAVKDRQQVQIRRVEKALRHEVHGMNIYAYNHMRTNQVVYSLTKILDNTKVLSQLQFHGKKTVPAAVRRDMWTPYFSLHFPPTESGAQAGLLAYHRLRELSTRRQLSPPKELYITTQADIDRIKAKHSPLDLQFSNKLKIPLLGQHLPQQLRAKKLMNQKATSVADVAFVLSSQNTSLTPIEKEKQRLERLASKGDGRSQRYVRRLKMLKARHQKLLNELEERKLLVNREEGQLPLDKYATARISMEYQSVIGRSSTSTYGQVFNLTKIEEAKDPKAAEAKMLAEILAAEEAEKGESNLGKKGKNVQAGENVEAQAMSQEGGMAGQPKKTEGENSLKEIPQIKILWADMRDGTYAPEWPQNVVHGELEPQAVTKGLGLPDGGEEERPILSRTVHVMGGEAGSGWWLPPAKFVPPEKAEVEAPTAIKVADKKNARRILDMKLDIQAANLLTDCLVIAYAQRMKAGSKLTFLNLQQRHILSELHRMKAGLPQLEGEEQPKGDGEVESEVDGAGWLTEAEENDPFYHTKQELNAAIHRLDTLKEESQEWVDDGDFTKTASRMLNLSRLVARNTREAEAGGLKNASTKTQGASGQDGPAAAYMSQKTVGLNQVAYKLLEELGTSHSQLREIAKSLVDQETSIEDSERLLRNQEYARTLRSFKYTAGVDELEEQLAKQKKELQQSYTKWNINAPLSTTDAEIGTAKVERETPETAEGGWFQKLRKKIW